MWFQPHAKKHEKWLQPGSNDFNVYPFNSLLENKKTRNPVTRLVTGFSFCIELFCCEWQILIEQGFIDISGGNRGAIKYTFIPIISSLAIFQF